jgi:CHAT domain-containing protein
LWNRRSEQYLIEEYRLLISPEFPRSDAASSADLDIQSAALFGNTASASSRPLNAVDQETSDIAHILQSTASVQIFTDNDATRTNFLDALANYDLVHFAGHGEVDTQHPLLSQLVLGSATNEAQNIVTAADLYEFRPARMPALVVLAACDTAAYSDRLQHAVTLVRPILDIGAREVIGSLRPIPDVAYMRLMVRFYQELMQTGNAAQALHRVQVQDAINASPGDPGYWAFIQIFSYL